MDAGLFGNRLGLEEAYRFARGEQVTASTGQPAKLARPLDWIVIADHSDMMGFVFDIKDGDPQVVATEQGERWHKMMNGTPQEGVEAALDLITTFSNTRMDPQTGRGLCAGFRKVQRYLGTDHCRGRQIQRPRAVYRPDRLRVDLPGQGRQHAPQRYLPR